MKTHNTYNFGRALLKKNFTEALHQLEILNEDPDDYVNEEDLLFSVFKNWKECKAASSLLTAVLSKYKNYVYPENEPVKVITMALDTESTYVVKVIASHFYNFLEKNLSSLSPDLCNKLSKHEILEPKSDYNKVNIGLTTGLLTDFDDFDSTELHYKLAISGNIPVYEDANCCIIL